MGSSGLTFILLYVFAFATSVVFMRLMKDRRRIAIEQESLPLAVKQIRFFVIGLISIVSGWGAITGQFSADFAGTVFYGGIALTTFLTSQSNV